MLQMRPMTAGEFRAYRARAIEGYARDLVASGQNTTDDAAPRAQRCFDTLLPDGLSTPARRSSRSSIRRAARRSATSGMRS